MISEYVNKLIENLPNEMKTNKTPLKLDIVLDGGVFNGSYLFGALYFLKEMEKRNYICVERISGCSIGSIAGLLYFIDDLDFMTNLYNLVYTEFKKTHTLKVLKDMKSHFINKIPLDICAKVKNKFYITYYNIKKNTKHVKYKYKNTDDLINTIIKSCFVPYLIDGNALHENKYLDGLSPYIFKTERNKKILYLDLFGFDKIGNLLNVKNEKTNFHRVLAGLLDIHSFYIKQSSTHMCSYVNDWTVTNHIGFYIKIICEKMFIYFAYFLMYIKKNIPCEIENGVLCKLLTKILQEVIIVILDTYCL
jgi:hypothetical protein